MSTALRIVTGFFFATALGCAATDDTGGRSDKGAKDLDIVVDDGTEPNGTEDTSADSSDGRPRGCGKMDILFVIDDSGSMECEQQFLGQTFPRFIEVLDTYSNDFASQVSYRIGVTTTWRSFTYSIGKPGPFNPPYTENADGQDGDLVTLPGMAAPWIEGPGNKIELESLFATLAFRGTGGSGYEMPLEGMRLALAKDAPGQPNEGFLREDSLFIAIVITDEDDCSRTDDNFVIDPYAIEPFNCMHPKPDPKLEPLTTYREALDERFGGPDNYVFVAMAGRNRCGAEVYPTKCDSDDGQYAGAAQAIRLFEFVHGYVNKDGGKNGMFIDICTSDLADALAGALDKMQVACNNFTPR